jgi:hypothetical protein
MGDRFVQDAGGGSAGDDDFARASTFHDSLEGFEAEAAAHFRSAVAGEAVAGEDGTDIVVVIGMLALLGEGGGQSEE